MADVQLNAEKTVGGMQFVSGDSNTKRMAVSDMIVCGTQLTAEEYLPTAQAQLEKAYYAMVGKAAEGTEPAKPGTHERNKETITQIYQLINLSTIDDINQMINEVKNFQNVAKEFDSDADIEAAIAELVTYIEGVNTEQAGNYTVEGEGMNKLQFEQLIASLTDEVKASFMSVYEINSWKENFAQQLEQIETDTEYAERLLREAKEAANETLKATWAEYLAADTEVSGANKDIKLTVKTAWDTAKEAVKNAETPSAVDLALTDFNGARDGALASDNIDDYKAAGCKAVEDYAKTIANGLDSPSNQLVADINNAVVAGKAAINATTVTDNAGVDAAVANAKLAIDKLVAVDTLTKEYNAAVSRIGTAKTTALESVHGESAAATTATSAINTAENTVKSFDKDDAITALNAATAETLGTLLDEKVSAIQNLEAEQQTAITDAIATLQATEFTITLDGTTGATAAKVTYGGTVVIDESAVADTVIIKGWYKEAAKENLFDFATLIYDDLTLYPDAAEAIKIDGQYKFNYKQLTAVTDQTVITELQGADNEFITLGSGTVKYRTSDGGAGAECLQVSGEALSLTVHGTGKITLSIRSTGSKNYTAFCLKKNGGDNVAASTVDSAFVACDNNVYYINNGPKSISFDVTEGTYTLCTVDSATKDGTAVAQTFGELRLYSLTMTDVYKVEKVAVEGVAISEGASASIAEATGTLQLNAVVNPTNANIKTVTWSSDNEEVATVDNNGLVTAHAQGLVTITVTTTDGNKTASILIDVASFATAVQSAVAEITNKNDDAITTAGNADKLATLKTETLAKIVASGVPQISTGAQLTDIMAEFNAKFEALKTTQVKLTMNYEGGSKDENVPSGGSLAVYAPDEAVQSKPGFKLVGWKDAANNDFDFATSTITADTVITAQYEEVVVTFNLDGGTGETSTELTGGKVTKPATDPTKTGFDFAGWYVGDVEYNFDTVLYEDVTITAHWTARKQERTVGFSSTDATVITNINNSRTAGSYYDTYKVLDFVYDSDVTSETKNSDTHVKFGGQLGTNARHIKIDLSKLEGTAKVSFTTFSGSASRALFISESISKDSTNALANGIANVAAANGTASVTNLEVACGKVYYICASGTVSLSAITVTFLA